MNNYLESDDLAWPSYIIRITFAHLIHILCGFQLLHHRNPHNQLLQSGAQFMYTQPHFMPTQLNENNVNALSMPQNIASFAQRNQPIAAHSRNPSFPSRIPTTFANLQNVSCWLNVWLSQRMSAYETNHHNLWSTFPLQDIIYAELMVSSPIQQPHFTATLGRPRARKVKQEPTIYAQVSCI